MSQLVLGCLGIFQKAAPISTVDFFSAKSEYSAIAGVVSHPSASRESEVKARQGVRGAQTILYEWYSAELACSPIGAGSTGEADMFSG
jgi:hypothetical protein